MSHRNEIFEGAEKNFYKNGSLYCSKKLKQNRNNKKTRATQIKRFDGI